MRELFARFDTAEGGDAERIWDELAALLETHAAAEEQTFYPALLNAGDNAKPETKDAIKDHNKIRDAVRRAAECDPGSEQWRKAIADAREQNSDHMAEEERGALPDFRKNTEEQRRAELGERFKRFEEEHAGARGIDTSDKSPKKYIAEHAEK